MSCAEDTTSDRVSPILQAAAQELESTTTTAAAASSSRAVVPLSCCSSYTETASATGYSASSSLTTSSARDCSDRPGPSATSMRGSFVSSSGEGGDGSSKSTDSVEEEEVSDSDIDVDSETLLDVGQSSHDNHVISHRSGGGSRGPTRRRGRRGKRGNISAEEILRKQETACQIHNENERIRRKDLRSAVIGLRRQLVRPTKRPAVKLVLEAAIHELQDLKEKEMAELKLLESLKDREKRLTFELENKMKEYKRDQLSGPSSSSVLHATPPPYIPHPAATAGAGVPQPLFASPLHTIPALCPLEPSAVVNPVNPMMLYPPLLRLPLPHNPSLHSTPFRLPIIPSQIPQSPFLVQNSHPLLHPMYSFLPPLTSVYPPATLTPHIAATLTPHIAGLPVMHHGMSPQHPMQTEPQRQQLIAPGSPMTPFHSQPAREHLQSAERHTATSEIHYTTKADSTKADSTKAEDSCPRRKSSKSGSSKNGGESVEIESRPPPGVFKYTSSADSTRAPPALLLDNDCYSTQPPRTAQGAFIDERPMTTISIVKPILLSRGPQCTGHKITKHGRRPMPPLLRIESESELRSIQKASQSSELELRCHMKLQSSQISNPDLELLTVEHCKNPYYTNKRSSSSSLRTHCFQRKRRNTSTTDTESSEEDSSTELLQHPHAHSIANYIMP